ncbi:MAG: orotidine-5'-phosphate decarboxylase [Defluviitaleaceae bacterium]|nr:orotidine-5'-phosphate decarboxylase [Defluviitaleaceae bacterium]
MMDRLVSRIIELQSPIVVGLDPRLSQVPGFIKEAVFADKGKTPAAVADIFYRFNKEIIDHIYDLVPAVKPQIALYEQLGIPGIDCYLKTIEYAKSKGLLVIGDVKRGDIASTAEAYSHGHIGMVDIEGTSHTIFNEDFITVNPYMGHDSVEPYLADCKNYGKGIFVLVKTSNPGSRDIQDMLVTDKKTAEAFPIYHHVGKLVSEWGNQLIGKHGFSAVGAVVGATHPEEGKVLRENMPHTFFLVPGYGAQGGTAKDLQGMFNKDRLGIIVNSSRGITGAFQMGAYSSYGEANFAEASRAAVLDMKKDLMS